MKRALERYVRSLKEREDAPERFQDLGTLVCWILERHGYTLLERPFKFDAEKLRVNRGRLQHGIDLLAIKPDSDGALNSYRFVLKQGSFGKAQFTPEVEGTLLHDLELAASVPTQDREERRGIHPVTVTIVAVHNGSVDHEQIGGNLRSFLSTIERRYAATRTDWWDADRLVELVLGADSERFDASVFPPLARPFFALALNSLVPEKGTAGAGFDNQAIDLAVNERIPVSEEAPSSIEALTRVAAELGLFALMIRAECDRVGGGTTLPVFDSIERILCRLAESSRSLSRAGRDLVAVVDMLVDVYVDAAQRLADRLELLTDVADGLALPAPGEVVSFPLRTLRLSGYLATAGLGLILRARGARPDDGSTASARRLAVLLAKLWERNPGGCFNPITDDQVIELGLAWELWLRLRMLEPILSSTRALVERMALRRATGLPLPSLWHRARNPIRHEDLVALVEVHALGLRKATATFEDGASTILPLALYLSLELGGTVDADALQALSLPSEGSSPLFSQVWQPPEDAPTKWYASAIEYEGVASTIDIGDPEFVTVFERLAELIPPSHMEGMGLGVVDRMAWKLWRTPPPMALFVQLVRAGSRAV